MLPARFDREARDALARRHWPSGMGITADDDQLLSRGWPHLAVLVPDHRDDRAPADAAFAVMTAIDPVYGPRWPREAARRYLHAMAAASAGRPTRAPLEAALACTDPVTTDTADRIIARTRSSIDGYPFHFRQALYLLEAELGAAVLGDRIVAAIEALTAKDWLFGNIHLRFLETIFVLECCLLRSPRARAEALFERVGAAWQRRPAEEGFPPLYPRLRLLLEGSQGADTRWYGVYNLPFLTDDEALVRHRLEHQYVGWLVDPQYLRLFGPDIVPPRAYAGLRRDPAWKQQLDVEIYGIIDHPLAVRWMAAMLGSRGAVGLPEQWLLAHLDRARPVLESLAARGSPHAAIIAAVLAGDTRAVKKARSVKPPTAKQLKTAMAKIFTELRAALGAGRGHADRERAALEQAVHAIIELKASTGDPLPEAQVGHLLAVDGWGKLPPPLPALEPSEAELDRWYALITAAC